MAEELTPFQRRFSDPDELEGVTEDEKQELERRFRNRQVKRLIRRKIASLGHQDQERLAEQLVLETLRIACFDIRSLYHPDGTLKEAHELDDDTAAAIAGIELESRYDEAGTEWTTKKYKVVDKNKAIELFFKYIRHLVPDLKVEHTVFHVLADRLARARERERTDSATSAEALPGSPPMLEGSTSGPAPDAGGE